MQGPIYCETGHPWFGIAEPVNFATNAFIIVAALLAARLIAQSPQRSSAGLWLLVVLLFSTGIGSFLWHGLRTPFTLALDTWSGILFLLALIWLWLGALYGRVVGLFGTVGFVAAAFGSLVLSFRLMPASDPTLRPLMLLPFFLTVIAAGTGLVAATRRKAGTAAAGLGTAALVCGLIAAVGRSVDLPLCRAIPFGTHFVWHMFLSLAAYLSIVMLVRLKSFSSDKA
jgi:hypothetical protein